MIIKTLTNFIKENINSYNSIIDYTILNTLTNDDIKKLGSIAETNNFYSVCILPDYVSVVSSFLDNNDIKIVAVVDFPKGESDTSEKIKEIDKSLVNGADEIDVVINYKLIKKDQDDLVDEIRKLVEYVHKEGKIIKIVIEIGFLNFQELEKICNICVEANADFIMTSTGKLSNDDSFEEKVEKVEFMRKIIPNDTQIKFSGGIRTNDQIKEIAQYCDRVGTSKIPV